MLDRKELEHLGLAFAANLPTGWRHLSDVSLGYAMAEPLGKALKEAATVGCYTQNVAEGFYAGVRTIKTS